MKLYVLSAALSLLQTAIWLIVAHKIVRRWLDPRFLRMAARGRKPERARLGSLGAVLIIAPFLNLAFTRWIGVLDYNYSVRAGPDGADVKTVTRVTFTTRLLLYLMRPQRGNQVTVWTEEEADVRVAWAPQQAEALRFLKGPNGESPTVIQRIVALPGEQVEIDRRGRVFIGGVALQEDYLTTLEHDRAIAQPLSIKLDRDRYVVADDSRTDALRHEKPFYLVHRRQIRSREVFVLWPRPRLLRPIPYNVPNPPALQINLDRRVATMLTTM